MFRELSAGPPHADHPGSMRAVPEGVNAILDKEKPRGEQKTCCVRPVEHTLGVGGRPGPELATFCVCFHAQEETTSPFTGLEIDT